MSPFDEKLDDWQERIARFRRFTALLGENEAMAPLRALAQAMEQNLLKRRALSARSDELMALRDVMMAEIDIVLACARNRRLQPAPGFSPADLREESRLCREEASAALDVATQRAFARRALDLAMLGEQRTREEDA
jgi:hypothetical protein